MLQYIDIYIYSTQNIPKIILNITNKYMNQIDA